MSKHKGSNAHLLQRTAGQFLSLGNEKVNNQVSSSNERKKKKTKKKM